MIIDVDTKNIIVEELKFIAEKMKATSNAAEKLFLFSAVYAAFQRAFNLDYNGDLVYVHVIVRLTYETLIQRLRALQGGDTTIPLPDELFDRLESLTKELGEEIEKGEAIDDTLKGFVLLQHSVTGNGHYLRLKGLGQF